MFIKKYLMLIVLSVIMLTVGVAVIIGDISADGNIFESVFFYDSQYRLRIRPQYDDKTDKYYLFLPSYTDIDRMSVTSEIGTSFRFSVNGEAYKNIADLPLSTDIVMTADNAVSKNSATLQILQCENLPTVYVKTDSDTMEFVNASRDNKEKVAAQIIDCDGEMKYFGGAELSVRGNGTWKNEKKPYNLTLENSISLGEFESITKLSLLAEFGDESKMRNAVAYYAAYRQNMPYASEYTYCELYVNGEFYGLYGVVTKEEYTSHIEEDGIKAVFEIASGVNKNQFVSELDKKINVIYGDLSFVKERVQQFERSLQAQDWESCSQYIDVESFAQKYAFEEMIANYDCTYASQYFYMGDDGLIRCMLPWDYDWSLGSVVDFFNDIQSNEILAYRNKTCWYTLLIQWDDFAESVVGQLKSNYTDDYFAELNEYALKTAKKIETDRELNDLLWGSAAETYVPSGMQTTVEFAEYFDAFLKERKKFLTEYFTEPEKFYCVEFQYRDIYRYLNICIPVGDDIFDYLENSNYFKLLSTDEDFLGFYTEDGLNINDMDTVTENMIFYAELKSAQESSDSTAADDSSDSTSVTPTEDTAP